MTHNPSLEYIFGLAEDEDLTVTIDGNSLNVSDKDRDRFITLSLNDFDMLAAEVAKYRNMRKAGGID